jgi:hypothetical protein
MNPEEVNSPSAKAADTNAMAKKNKLSLRLKIREQPSILKELLAQPTPAAEPLCEGAGVINERPMARRRSRKASVVLDGTDSLPVISPPCRRTAQEEQRLLRDLRKRNALYRGLENVDPSTSVVCRQAIPQVAPHMPGRPSCLSPLNGSDGQVAIPITAPNEATSQTQEANDVSIIINFFLLFFFASV